MNRTAYYYRTAADILGRIQYATLATVTEDGRPWNSPVWAMHDNSLCFYWFSDKQSQHSKNIRANDKAFIVIYDSTLSQDLPTGNRNGLYIQARAEELEDIQEIRRLRQAKSKGHADDAVNFVGRAVRRAYKAIPEKIWMNDAEFDEQGAFIRDYRVQLSMDRLKLAIVLGKAVK